MSFAKKALNPFGIMKAANPLGLISEKLDPVGKFIHKKGFDSHATDFGGRTGDWFTKKRADLTGSALLASRGVNPDGSSMSPSQSRMYRRRPATLG